MTSIIIDTAKLSDTWCVYEHHAQLAADKPPEVIFVGYCKLADVLRLRDARVNSEWNTIFAAGGQVMVKIIAQDVDRDAIVRHAQAHMRTFTPMPRCNLRGFALKGANRPVRCDTTGKMYASQKDAANDMGISQSAISRHLKGDLTHVAGNVFSYVSGR